MCFNDSDNREDVWALLPYFTFLFLRVHSDIFQVVLILQKVLFLRPVVFSSAQVEPGACLGPPGVAELVVATGSLKVTWRENG